MDNSILWRGARITNIDIMVLRMSILTNSVATSFITGKTSSKYYPDDS